jgi:hypothetical protein
VCAEGSSLFVGYVKYEVDDEHFEELGRSRNSCLSPAGYCEAVSVYLAGHFDAEALVVADGDTSVCITIPEDCTMITAAASKEPQQPPGPPGPEDCDFSPDGGDGVRTVCFEKDDGGGVSYVELGVECCVPHDVIAECS